MINLERSNNKKKRKIYKNVSLIMIFNKQSFILRFLRYYYMFNLKILKCSSMLSFK